MDLISVLFTIEGVTWEWHHPVGSLDVSDGLVLGKCTPSDNFATLLN